MLLMKGLIVMNSDQNDNKTYQNSELFEYLKHTSMYLINQMIRNTFLISDGQDV